MAISAEVQGWRSLHFAAAKRSTHKTDKDPGWQDEEYWEETTEQIGRYDS